MTTLARSIMPVPDQIVVGSGSYVIPANRYGFISMTTSSSAAGYGITSNNDGGVVAAGCSGGSNSNHQYLKAGTSISVQSSAPSGTTNAGSGVATRATDGYARILIDGVVCCVSNSSSASSSYRASNTNLAYTQHFSSVGWSVSLFRIPKANFPVGTAEGE